MNYAHWVSPAGAAALSGAARKRLIVFDYDGTLADLQVDWGALRADLSRRARDFGFMSTFQPLWPQMTRLRDACGAEAVAALFAVLAEHERQGVVQQQPRAEMVEFARLMAHARVLAVFSANLHASVAAGLDALGLGSLISWIVGADDVTQWKPAPEGLLRAMQLAGCTPADTLFIGNSAGDAAAAHAASVDCWCI
jgi:phosphoglycolate phosphatase-like HAD superfamily hydrolase